MKRISASFIIIAIITTQLIVTPSCYANNSSNIGRLTTLSVGARHAAAIKNDGTLWLWGTNDYGQIGNGTQEDQDEPVEVLDDVISVSCGRNHTMAIKSDGSLWGWGENLYGQIGTGDNTDAYMSPVKIMDDVVSVVSGDMLTMAIKSDNTMWAWGNNGFGEFGDGQESQSFSPAEIMPNVGLVSVGYGYNMALKTDGTLWTWKSKCGQGEGYNNIPIKIMSNVISISAGSFNNMAIKSDGSLWAWGFNWQGNLGDGTTNDSDIPIKILSNIISVTTSGGHGLAIKSDDSLWSWGFNESGELGDGTTDDNPTPSKIMESVAAVNTWQQNSIALKNDGTVWVWGADSYGTHLEDAINEAVGDILIPQKVISDVRVPEKLTISNAPLDDNLNQSTVADPQINTAIQQSPPSQAIATPSKSHLFVDSKDLTMECYLINGNNYFKLRDIANAVNGSEKQFNVIWDEESKSIFIIINQDYAKTGGEFSSGDGKAKSAKLNNATIHVGDTPVILTAYNINGYNFVKLRDIAQVIDAGVAYDSTTKAINIDTSTGYVSE